MRGISLASMPVMSLCASLAYVIAFYLSDWFATASILRSLIGAIIIFYLLGASLRTFLDRVARSHTKLNPLSVGALSFDFLTSLFIVITISTILVQIFLFHESLLVGLIIGIVTALSIACLMPQLGDASTAPTKEGAFGKARFASIVPVLILGLSSVIFASFFRGKTPFPSLNGWDMNSALAVINWILSHHGYEYILIPAYPNALLPYPAPFFFLLASYSIFLGIDSFALYWYSVYLSIFFYMSLVYLLAVGVSKNHYLSLTSAFIAFFAGTGFAEVVRTPLYLTLDLVGQLFFLLILVFHMFYRGVGKGVLCLVAVAYLAILNFFTAVAVFPFLLYVVLGERGLPLFGNRRRSFRIATVLMALIIPIFMYLSSSISPVFASYFSPPDGAFPLSLKLQTFGAIYLPYFLVMFLLTLSVVTVRHFRGRTVLPDHIDILLYISAGFIIYFQPAYITYRIEFYVRVFMAIFISALLPSKAE